jgi:nascent polypeptide-associated complex subunit alpha
MFPGMGKMNPAQMKALMRQFGIKSEDIPAKRVIFELDEGRIIIEEPQVTAMHVQGQKTYTVMGEEKTEKNGIPESDIEMVAEQTNSSKEKAKKALEETNGDIAEAILKLKK